MVGGLWRQLCWCEKGLKSPILVRSGRSKHSMACYRSEAPMLRIGLDRLKRMFGERSLLYAIGISNLGTNGIKKGDIPILTI